MKDERSSMKGYPIEMFQIIDAISNHESLFFYYYSLNIKFTIKADCKKFINRLDFVINGIIYSRIVLFNLIKYRNWVRSLKIEFADVWNNVKKNYFDVVISGLTGLYPP